MPVVFWLMLFFIAGVQASELAVDKGYVREVIPGQANTAAFFTLVNKGAEDCRLAAATSAGAGRVEIHRHRHDNGVMRMRRVEGVAVPAGGSVTFAPGGYHLMLFGVKALRAGEKLPLFLDLGACGTLKWVAPVVPAGHRPSGPGH